MNAKYVPVKYDPIPCLECSENFTPNRVDKRFCSKHCYRKYGKKNLNHSNGDKETIRRKVRINKRKYIVHKKSICEQCGFIPEHSCQLDVDHIDGNHNNNDLSNLQTLCANCHRLKTFLNKDWK